ncbi:WXG100 family type VII secretion target (plasmid) [Mycolicibacterium aichiense]|uniref:WXG100 family type VII secretion target n=1 Tax=Mycolicibacterium aichiense TaxID=1799 RepID=UPI003D67768C
MAQIKVDHGSVVALANQMDELSHRAQDVLARYEEAVNHAHASQALRGSAGSTNLVTGAEIKDAQLKIQARFQAVNDLLRSGATKYTGADEENAHNVASVAGSLRFT